MRIGSVPDIKHWAAGPNNKYCIDEIADAFLAVSISRESFTAKVRVSETLQQ